MGQEADGLELPVPFGRRVPFRDHHRPFPPSHPACVVDRCLSCASVLSLPARGSPSQSRGRGFLSTRLVCCARSSSSGRTWPFSYPGEQSQTPVHSLAREHFSRKILRLLK